jgi:biotin operon repressor
MTISHSNAVLAPDTSDTTAQPSSLRLASDVRGYSTTPTAHVRDLVADGIKGNGLAVYFAIADRQVYDKVTKAKGEYFRSNESLAEEAGVSKSNVRKWIAILKKNGYISVWFKNGGRRMRVCTKVCSTGSRGVTPTEQGGDSQGTPYKENNIKKTTQQKMRGVSFLTEKHRVLFGEGSINKLVADFGEAKVQSGLLAFDAEDASKIRNPNGWLNDAIKYGYEPRTATAKAERFTEDTFEHHRIIRDYSQMSEANAATVEKLIKQGKDEGIIAYKISSNKL